MMIERYPGRIDVCRPYHRRGEATGPSTGTMDSLSNLTRCNYSENERVQSGQSQTTNTFLDGWINPPRRRYRYTHLHTDMNDTSDHHHNYY